MAEHNQFLAVVEEKKKGKLEILFYIFAPNYRNNIFLFLKLLQPIRISKDNNLVYRLSFSINLSLFAEQEDYILFRIRKCYILRCFTKGKIR